MLYKAVRMMKKNFAMELTSYRTSITVSAIIFAIVSIISPANMSFAQTDTGSAATASETASMRVSIGEGSNATIQHYTFTPQSVEINAGESVTWVSPSELSDIHTVTFVQDPSIVSDIILPFAVSGGTNFELLQPFNVGEPVMVQAPDGTQAIVALNKHTWYPAVLDANNQTIYLNGTDIQYTMSGTEKVINSGIILRSMPPESEGEGSSTTTGQTPMGPPFPPVSSFTMTFEEPGTYPYFCAIHPWMIGQVIVREGGESAVENQAPVTTPSPSELQPPVEQSQSFAEEQLPDASEEVLVEDEDEEEQEEESECHPSYPDFCIPPPPPDLNCDDISGRRFTVLSPDPHGLDGNDNDGIGCES
jgi:plastocyanin